MKAYIYVYTVHITQILYNLRDEVRSVIREPSARQVLASNTTHFPPRKPQQESSARKRDV